MAKILSYRSSKDGTTVGGLSRSWLLSLIILGFVLRLGIAAISWGSNDAPYFWIYSRIITDHGLLAVYRIHPDYNHPPGPGLWAAAVLWITELFHGEMSLFLFIFKLPLILADGFAAWLLWKRWKPLVGSMPTLRTVASYSMCIAAILISGYHANTDSGYAMFSLLAVYLIEDRQSYFLGGLALAAAINVKLVPVLLIVPLLLSFRRPSEAARFLAGLSLGVIPFLPPLIWMGPSFYARSLAYKSVLQRWGLMLPPLWNRSWEPGQEGPWVHWYNAYGRSIIMALTISWGVVARWLGRWNRYEVVTATYAIFLVFASGFGVQYLIVLVPLLFAFRPGFAAFYGALAGLFLLLTYFLYWEGLFPLGSFFMGYFPHPSAALGGVVWASLVFYLVQTIARPARFVRSGVSSESVAGDLDVAIAQHSAPITKK